MDGGGIELVGVEGNIVKVRLTGACGSCPMSTMTLKMGVDEERYQNAWAVAEQVLGVIGYRDAPFGQDPAAAATGCAFEGRVDIAAAVAVAVDPGVEQRQGDSRARHVAGALDRIGAVIGRVGRSADVGTVHRIGEPANVVVGQQCGNMKIDIHTGIEGLVMPAIGPTAA